MGSIEVGSEALRPTRTELDGLEILSRVRPGAPIVGLLLVVGGLGLQWVLARSPELVERVFARGLYPLLGGRLGCLTRLLPISLGECIVLVLAGWLAVAFWRLARARERRPRLRRLRRAALPVAAALYLAFLLLWGLNYQRQPFAVSARLDVRPSRIDELAALGAILVDEANQAREGLPEDGAGIMRLADGRLHALARTEAGFREAASLYPVLAGCPARPKPLLTSIVFSWLGVTGIYFPFTGEPNVNMTLPDPELPFAAAHEIVHQRGFAREDEANYLGYLACRLHPDPDFRYSGRLAASVYAVNALTALDRKAGDRLDAGRSPGTRRDLAALMAWAERYRGPAERVSQRVNDAYLRSQGEAQGVRSYGRVVDLLLAERRARPSSVCPPRAWTPPSAQRDGPPVGHDLTCRGIGYTLERCPCLHDG